MKLDGKSVIITGALSGIGKAAAILFAGEGARLTLLSRSEKGKDVAKQAREMGAGAQYIKADVSKVGDWDKAIKLAMESYGGVDVLYNNAGIGMYRPFLETSEEDWDAIVDNDLKSVFLGCRRVIPEMLKSGRGVIVNTASEIGISGARNYAAYCAAKGGRRPDNTCPRHRVRGQKHTSQLPLPRGHPHTHARTGHEQLAGPSSQTQKPRT